MLSEPDLPVFDYFYKFGDIQQPFLLRQRKCSMQAFRNDESKPLVLHLLGLVVTDRSFKRQEMLAVDSFGFRQDLPPAILARTDAEHR